MSLVDDTVRGPIARLPPGHPFDSVQVDNLLYWSSTTFSTETTAAWGAFLSEGATGVFGKVVPAHVWCMRGGSGVDTQ